MRKNLPRSFCDAASDEICKKLVSTEQFKRNQFIYIYADVRGEVATGNVIDIALKSGKTVACPKVSDGDMQFYRIRSMSELATGSFGIPEPDTGEAVDTPGLVVMPGVVFDFDCRRIGYGGGYYDRYLSERHFETAALAYDMQVVPRIPSDDNDVRADMIITEKNIYYQR